MDRTSGHQLESRVLSNAGLLDQLAGDAPGRVQFGSDEAIEPQNVQHRERLWRVSAFVVG